MFEYFFLIIWHVGKPKEPKKGTLKILPQNLNPPPGGPLCIVFVFKTNNRNKIIQDFFKEMNDSN